MWILAHSPIKRLTGPSLRQKTYAQPPWQLFICSVDAGGFLVLPTESSAPSPKGALTGNWTQKRMHQKPNGSCLCSGKRDLRERGPPNPPVQFTHPLSFLCPCLPQAPPLRLHPAFTVHSQGCCNEGMEEQRWFMKPVLLLSPQPLAPLHELSTEAEEASDFKTGCICSESKGLPDFFDHLFCIPYHTQSIVWINENKKPPSLHQVSPCSFSLIRFTPCPWLFSSKIPAHPQQRTGQTCPSSPFHLLGYLPGFKFLSCS